MSLKKNPRATLLITWAMLMLLLAVTWGVARFDLGFLNVVAAIVIALFKMALVMLVFMQLRQHSRLVWVSASVGFVWLLIMITLTLSDYMSRGRVHPGDAIISYWQDGQPPTPPFDHPVK